MGSSRLDEYGRVWTQEPREENKNAPRRQDSTYDSCLLYTSDAADERSSVDLGGRRIIKKKKKKDEHRSTDESQQNNKSWY